MNDYFFTRFCLNEGSCLLDRCRAVMQNMREKYPDLSLFLKRHPTQTGYLLLTKDQKDNSFEMVEVLPETGLCLYTKGLLKGERLLQEVKMVFSLTLPITGPVSRSQWDLLDRFDLVKDACF